MHLQLLATLTLAGLLAIAATIDLRTRRIPDVLNLATAIAGLTATWLLQRDMWVSLIGIAAGYVALFLVSVGYRQLRGRDGLGLGDAKLLAGGGAWIGWMGLPFAVLMAAGAGLVFVAVSNLAGRKLTAIDALPFGPFLAAGIFATWLAPFVLQR